MVPCEFIVNFPMPLTHNDHIKEHRNTLAQHLKRMSVFEGFLCIPWLCIVCMPSVSIQHSAFTQEMKLSSTRLWSPGGTGFSLLAVLFLLPSRSLTHSRNSINTCQMYLRTDSSYFVDCLSYYKYLLYAVDK